MAEPKKNTAFTFAIGLVATAARPAFKANPTIAAGDFKVSTDGAAFANLATLPSVAPALGTRVQIDLSAAEMNGDNIYVQCIDAAGAEWDDVLITIDTSVRNTDDLATPTNITAGTITTVTNLTNLPAAAALEATAQSILTDTNELQTDWANGGRLDLILDARASQTSVDDLPTNAELATALGTADDAVLAAIPSAATVATAVWAKTLP